MLGLVMRRLPIILLGLFLIAVAFSAIRPLHPRDWLLENALVVLLLIPLIGSARRYPLSTASYLCLFVFLCLHELGAHYSYTNVPYPQWFGWADDGRNHFDRLIHFIYGLLLSWPLREVLIKTSGLKPGWSEFFTLTLIMASSMLYELMEWQAAVIFGEDLGQAFLGTQGDEWDAHKDMALACLGALITLSIPVISRLLKQRSLAHS